MDKGGTNTTNFLGNVNTKTLIADCGQVHIHEQPGPRPKVDVEKLIKENQQSILDMQGIVDTVKGCENLKDVKEIPSLLSMSFKDFIEMVEESCTSSDSQIEKKGVPITKQNIHKLDGKRYRHVMVCASAGHGKSSLLRHYAKQVADGQIHALKHIQLVVYLEFKELSSTDDVFLWQFVGAKCPKFRSDDKENIMKWMIDNPKKVLFVMDGLDEYDGNLKSAATTASYYDVGKQSSFIRCILNKTLFKGSIIISSSREVAIKNLPKDCHPQQVVTMNGFTEQSIDEVIRTVCGGDAARIIKSLNTKGRFLYYICSIPFFLIVTISVMLKNPDNRPDTLTSLMVHALVNFMDYTNEKESSAKIRKVTKLALYGMENNKSLFDASDLSKVGVTPSEISDFVIAFARESDSVVKAGIKEKNMRYSFQHKLFQEFYAALEVLLTNGHDKKSKNVIEKIFDNDSFKFVQLFMVGVIFNQNNLRLLNAKPELNDNINIPKEFIKNIIIRKITGEFFSEKYLYLLYECVDIINELALNIKRLFFNDDYFEELKLFNVACFLRVLPLCENLKNLSITTSVMDDEMMQSLIDTKSIPTVENLNMTTTSVSGKLLEIFVGCCKPKKSTVHYWRAHSNLPEIFLANSPLLSPEMGFWYTL